MATNVRSSSSDIVQRSPTGLMKSQQPICLQQYDFNNREMSFGEGLISSFIHGLPPAGKPVEHGSTAAEQISPAGPASRSIFTTENKAPFNQNKQMRVEDIRTKITSTEEEIYQLNETRKDVTSKMN